MKMLTSLTLTLALVAGSAFADPTASPTPSPASSPAAETYTCPMHPEVTSDHPSTCPKCGMKLTKKKKS